MLYIYKISEKHLAINIPVFIYYLYGNSSLLNNYQIIRLPKIVSKFDMRNYSAK